MTIWKYDLRLVDVQNVRLPVAAKILAVQVQRGVPRLWALVDPGAPEENRRIAIRGTGHPIDMAGEYIGTFQVEGGALVFHVFEGGA